MSSPQDAGAVPPAAAIDPAAAAAAEAANPSQPAKITAATTVSSMQDLKLKSPELYNAMMMGIATNIINQSKRATERLKEIIRQGTRNAQGR